MVGESKPAVFSRREFLSGFVVGAAGAVAAAMAAFLIDYFITPESAKLPPAKTISLGPASAVPVGTPTFLTYTQTVQEGWSTPSVTTGVWAVTQDGKNFVVFNSHCTHLGCLYAWNPGAHQFQCPCHGSIFDINGKVLGGPAPRPLDRIPNSVVNGTLQITVS